MAIREVRKIGDPILRKISKPVKNFDEKLHILLDDMHDTLAEYEGIGLAAPQVGILKRVFIIKYEDNKIEAINPEIVSHKGSQTSQEGCLSIPEEWYEVTRPNKVTLKAFDRFGNEFTINAEELLARAVCHENDHLDGILYVDKLEGAEKERRYEEGFIEE